MTTIQVLTANTGKFRRRMSTYQLISSTLIPDVSERMSHDCIHTNNYTYIHTYIQLLSSSSSFTSLLHCMRSVIYTHTVTVSSFVQDIRYFQYWYAGWRSIVVHHLSYPTCPHSCWVPVWAAGACTRSSTCQSPSLMVWCKYSIKS